MHKHRLNSWVGRYWMLRGLVLVSLESWTADFHFKLSVSVLFRFIWWSVVSRGNFKFGGLSILRKLTWLLKLILCMYLKRNTFIYCIPSHRCYLSNQIHSCTVYRHTNVYRHTTVTCPVQYIHILYTVTPLLLVQYITFTYCIRSHHCYLSSTIYLYTV